MEGREGTRLRAIQAATNLSIRVRRGCMGALLVECQEPSDEQFKRSGHPVCPPSVIPVLGYVIPNLFRDLIPSGRQPFLRDAEITDSCQ